MDSSCGKGRVHFPAISFKSNPPWSLTSAYQAVILGIKGQEKFERKFWKKKNI